MIHCCIATPQFIGYNIWELNKSIVYRYKTTGDLQKLGYNFFDLKINSFVNILQKINIATLSSCILQIYVMLDSYMASLPRHHVVNYSNQGRYIIYTRLIVNNRNPCCHIKTQLMTGHITWNEYTGIRLIESNMCWKQFKNLNVLLPHFLELYRVTLEEI